LEHQLFLVNEGTVAVGVMAVAMAVAFLMVVALGAYVLYCDAQNRAGERTLAAASDEGGHPVESVPEEPAPTPSSRRRNHPPAAH